MWQLLLCFFLFSFHIQAEEKLKKDLTPGIIESLKVLIDIDTKYQQGIIRDLGNSKPKGVEYINTNFSKLSFNREFLISFIFNTEDAPIALTQKSLCVLGEVLQLGNKINKNHKMNFYVLDEDTGNGKKALSVSRKAFSFFYLKQICPSSDFIINQKSYFPNFAASIPKYNFNNKQTCQQTFNEIKNSPYLSYYYSIGETLSETYKKDPKKFHNKKSLARVSKITNILGTDKTETILNFYSSINSKKSFCNTSGEKDLFAFYTKNLNTYAPIIQPICQSILEHYDILSYQEYSKCLSILKDSPDQCIYLGSHHVPSFSPKYTCDKLNKNLNHNLYSNLTMDCPGNVGNEGLINIARILGIFENKPETATNYLSNNLDCSIQRIIKFIDFSENADIKSSWGNSICYFNKFTQAEKCYPSFFSFKKHSMSVASVVENILEESKLAKGKIECTVINDFDLVKYRNQKFGCYIALSSTNCRADDCSFTVIYKGKELKNFFKYKGSISFDYFSKNYELEKFSYHNLVKRYLELKETTVFNTTQIHSLLETKKHVTIHGIGCAEDLLPQSFTRISLNSCSPIPFLITGAENNDVFVNLSIDSWLTPRKYNWSQIDASLKNYQNINPTRKWSLYALFK